MYDCMLGGAHNFAVDRAAVDAAVAANPQIVEAARANRDFLGRGMRWCAGREVDECPTVASRVERALAEHVAAGVQGKGGGAPRPAPRSRASPVSVRASSRAQQADQVHLAIERIGELMPRYTNEQLTSSEVIAQLVELAFYDAVSDNESAVELQGPDVLARIARELVAVMRRDVKTDWTVRDDVRAKLRSSIERLLVEYKYPPDQKAGAIVLVIEQMEAMAPRYAASTLSRLRAAPGRSTPARPR